MMTKGTVIPCYILHTQEIFSLKAKNKKPNLKQYRHHSETTHSATIWSYDSTEQGDLWLFLIIAIFAASYDNHLGPVLCRHAFAICNLHCQPPLSRMPRPCGIHLTTATETAANAIISHVVMGHCTSQPNRLVMELPVPISIVKWRLPV